MPSETERTETERMLAGEPYDPTDPDLVADRRRARDLTREYNRTAAGDDAARSDLLESLFGSGGATATVEPPVRCDYGYNVHVGEGFFANVGCVLLDVRRIEFGRNCLLGPGVHVYAASHPIDPEKRASGLESGDPVTVGDDVWIGGRAVLDPGVTVGDGAVVGSGAVVTEDVPPETIVKGNPASVVAEVETD